MSHGVSTHLQSPDPTIRIFGMIVGEYLSSKIYNEKDIPPLNFDLDINDPVVVNLRNLQNFDLNAIDEVIVEEITEEPTELKVEFEEKKVEKWKRFNQPDSDDEDEEDLLPFNINEYEGKSADLKYIPHCIEHLRSNEPDKIEIGLDSVVKLITKLPLKIVDEHSIELCFSLLDLKDSHNIDQFNERKENAAVTLI
ncbi:TEL2, telomere maintenance protein 2, partial [Nowakowskiella sp. JEL0078]